MGGGSKVQGLLLAARLALEDRNEISTNVRFVPKQAGTGHVPVWLTGLTCSQRTGFRVVEIAADTVFVGWC